LFFFIGLIEDTGYMARAAFIMDRVMSRVGLHGKSFVPLLSSFACAIPGIMGTRMIDHPKDRLVTILVAPLVSCSARLPVYSIMIAVMLPPAIGAWQKAGLMLGLYGLGTGAALGMAWIFRKTLVRGESTHLLLELPPYRRPSLRVTLARMWERSALFLKQAGTVILALSIVVWAFSSYPKPADPEATPAEALAHSVAGRIGHAAGTGDCAARLRLEDRRGDHQFLRGARGLCGDDVDHLRDREWRRRYAGVARSDDAGDPGGRNPDLHAFGLPEPDGVLRAGDAMSQHAGRGASRDAFLALADLSIRLHDGAGVAGAFLVYQGGRWLGFD
jgi:hypothetical protein